MTSTRFKEVGVTLEVGATVTDGNNIFLKVQTIQNVTTGQSVTGVPVVDTREANTSLLLQDSQTVVMGGLRREEKTKQTDQVPILGDLPLIGLLFKNVTTVSVHSELVVLLSPHIYRGEPVSGEVAAKVEAMRTGSPLHVGVATTPAPEPQRKEN
jgi:type II secretory pathway component GspD/PulD (secretin)